MNERIRELALQARVTGYFAAGTELATPIPLSPEIEKFAKLIVEATLDAVEQRAYYTGDRNWSDELDRPWVELEFGIGKLAELKND